MRFRLASIALAAVLSVAGLAAFRLTHRVENPGTLLPTGKYIDPTGSSTGVGSYPANMILTSDGRYAIVTDTGFREQVSVIDTSTGQLADKVDFNGLPAVGPKALYYGLATDRQGDLYASNGPLDTISTFKVGADGKLTKGADMQDASSSKDEPNFTAGLALSSDGKTLYVAHNEAYRDTGLRSSLSVISTVSGSITRRIRLPAFPLAVAAITRGPNADRKLYASCERDGVVASVNLATDQVTAIKTGMQPTGLVFNKAQDRLYVSNSGSDTVSIIDTGSNQVLKTILTRPAALRGLPGTTPLGLALSPDERYLYVALGDMNAVGVIDLGKGSLIGYLPAGWYPTSVVVAGNGLLLANAKGVKSPNPNGKPVGDLGQYIQNIIEGSVSRIDLPAAMANLPGETQRVLMSNFAQPGQAEARSAEFKNPGIKHVIYIVKENRTYDQVLGDDPRGNGDSSLTLFGKNVTPNLHALADRFVLLDNFNVCAEVSGDGWQWSTAGIASEYTSRNVPFNYSGRGRDYDFEGQTNGVTADFAHVPDVADTPGGYLWDACLRQHVSFRNYGFYVDPIDKEDAKGSGIDIPENGPTKKPLVKYTDDSFRQFDTDYADSDAWVLYQSPAPKQMKTFGHANAPSRFTEWKREFDEMVTKNKVPQFMMVRFMRDHTAGTAAGVNTPSAMVADNDYAVGQLVDAVSHSPIWKDTAIFILEDDAQNGKDHVDAHRSTAYVISPFVHPGLVDSRFYNTDSVLKTIELLLGLKPMNEYDAVANPLMVFDSSPANGATYRAVLPDRDILTAVNKATAYRAKDSERLISRFGEDSYADIQLNDILWHAVKGTPEPKAAESQEPETTVSGCLPSAFPRGLVMP